MNKKIIYILFTFFVFFIGLNTAYADCATIGNKITVYNSYKEQLQNIDCTDTTNEEIVKTCNEIKLKKNLIVTDLMQLRDNGGICGAYKTQVDSIIEENKDSCSQIFDDDFNNFVNKVMMVFYIVGPILLILFGTIDYAKAVVASDAGEIKKAHKKFVKRIVATILLFLAPIIVNIILSFNMSDYYLSGNGYACDFSYVVFNKKWNINYVPKKTKRTTGSASIGGTQIGDYILFNQEDPRWANERLINSQSGCTIGACGCAVSSVAIQIVNSGVETTQPVNPSTLNAFLRNYIKNGGGMVWDTRAIPDITNGKFVHYASSNLTGNIQNKTKQLEGYLNQGLYPVIQVKWGTATSSHYVAVFAVENGEVIIGNPGTGEVKILQNTSYPIAHNTYSSQVELYKVEK